MEAQPTPAADTASVANLTERRLREILNFDEQLGDLIHRGLWQSGIPPLGPMGRAIVSKISMDDLWAATFDKVKTNLTEEEISKYVTIIGKAQESLLGAFAIVGKIVEDTVATHSGKTK